MRILFSIFMAGILFALPVSQKLMAQHMGRGMGPRHGGQHNRKGPLFGDTQFLKDKLNLSEKQIQKIQSVNASVQSKLSRLRGEIRPLRRELGRHIRGGGIDLKWVREQLVKISKLETEIRYTMIAHKAKIEAVLSKEQRKQLQRERRSRMRGRHGRSRF